MCVFEMGSFYAPKRTVTLLGKTTQTKGFCILRISALNKLVDSFTFIFFSCMIPLLYFILSKEKVRRQLTAGLGFVCVKRCMFLLAFLLKKRKARTHVQTFGKFCIEIK